MEAVHLNYQFFHQNEGCSSKSGLVKIIILIDKSRKKILGCAPYAQSWVFFQNVQNSAFLLLHYSAIKKAAAMVFIEVIHRGYPFVCFEYKTPSERYLVVEL